MISGAVQNGVPHLVIANVITYQGSNLSEKINQSPECLMRVYITDLRRGCARSRRILWGGLPERFRSRHAKIGDFTPRHGDTGGVFRTRREEDVQGFEVSVDERRAPGVEVGHATGDIVREDELERNTSTLSEKRSIERRNVYIARGVTCCWRVFARQPRWN